MRGCKCCRLRADETKGLHALHDSEVQVVLLGRKEVAVLVPTHALVLLEVLNNLLGHLPGFLTLEDHVKDVPRLFISGQFQGHNIW
ncbi:hypothetical protein [Thermococcus sp. JCM 11816]|uniref:hypothetical protein n=1 Tax=Thermococcus sp. (strain JCM 11816 / KS-1) TaxID=1295125 RepID=UPI003464F7E6